MSSSDRLLCQLAAPKGRIGMPVRHQQPSGKGTARRACLRGLGNSERTDSPGISMSPLRFNSREAGGPTSLPTGLYLGLTPPRALEMRSLGSSVGDRPLIYVQGRKHCIFPWDFWFSPAFSCSFQLFPEDEEAFAKSCPSRSHPVSSLPERNDRRRPEGDLGDLGLSGTALTF